MLIQVMYIDDSHDKIESHTLSHMIREGRVKAFKRASGWVHVGKDRIRKNDYAGTERKSGNLARINTSESLETDFGGQYGSHSNNLTTSHFTIEKPS